MDIDDDVIDLSQVRDDFDLGNIKHNQNSFENLSNTNSLFQFNNINNNNNLSFFQNGLNKNNITSINNNSKNIQLPFNSMDDESDTEILIPLENENEELLTDVQPSFSLERGEEDATIEIELESYEKEKYSWFLKSPFKNKILTENNINNNDNNINSNNNNNNYNKSIISSNSSLNSVDFSFSNNNNNNNNNKLHIPKVLQSNSNNYFISTVSNNTVNNNESTNINFNLNEYNKKYTSENNDIENKSFLDIVENKNDLSQKEHELNKLGDNNLLKTNLNLENLGTLKIGDSLDEPKDFLTNNAIKPLINTGNILKQNNKNNDSSDDNNNLKEYKFKLDIDSKYSTNLNKSSFYKDKFTSLNKDINNKNSMINTENDITSEDLNELGRNINNNITNSSNNHFETRIPDMELSFEKFHHSPPSFLRSNSSDSFSKFSNDKSSESKKINSFSNDNSPFYGENKGLKSIEKSRSLSSLNLNNFNNARNDEINKKIEEIRERLKRNEKQDNKSKGNILNDTTFLFNNKTDFEPEIKINQENLFNNDSKKINLNDDDSDEASEILNSTSFDQLEISSEKEKRPPSKKKPFSLDSIKNLNSDSFSLNLKLSSSSSNSPNNTSLLHQSKRSSIPTFSQFYPSNKTNKTQKDSKKSKNSFLLNIPRSESPTLEQQLINPASTFRVAKYARLNTKLPMPSKVPRKLYDEYLNLRNDPMNNLQNVSEIKPVEPRKQAIPISKLRQPSKLRLRPNILNSSIHNNFS